MKASAALMHIRRCVARLEAAPDADPPDAARASDAGEPPPSESPARRHHHDGEGLSFVDLCSGKGFLSTMLAGPCGVSSFEFRV
jgi:hypothetical protein